MEWFTEHPNCAIERTVLLDGIPVATLSPVRNHQANTYRVLPLPKTKLPRELKTEAGYRVATSAGRITLQCDLAPSDQGVGWSYRIEGDPYPIIYDRYLCSGIVPTLWERIKLWRMGVVVRKDFFLLAGEFFGIRPLAIDFALQHPNLQIPWAMYLGDIKVAELSPTVGYRYRVDPVTQLDDIDVLTHEFWDRTQVYDAEYRNEELKLQYRDFIASLAVMPDGTFSVELLGLPGRLPLSQMEILAMKTCWTRNN